MTLLGFMHWPGNSGKSKETSGGSVSFAEEPTLFLAKVFHHPDHGTSSPGASSQLAPWSLLCFSSWLLGAWAIWVVGDGLAFDW